MDNVANSASTSIRGDVNKLYDGNFKVRVAVMLSDFIIVNILLLLVTQFLRGDVPTFLDRATKVCFLVLNFAMVIAQYFFHTIIDRRLVSYKEIFINVSKLIASHGVIFGVTLRLLFSSGGLFHFVILFTVVEFGIILLSRFVQRSILNRLRKHGKNSRSVIFVGSDPAVVKIYNRMVSNPTGGYHVKGYYADVRIKDEPEGLHWLGDKETLNRQLDKWNNEVLEEPDVDEMFCSLSHNEEKEIRFLMHACDRNVIHFFYAPRMFDNERLHLKPVQMGDYIYYSNRIQPLLRPENRLVKRTFDICFSLVVCIFLLPITIIVGIIIKLQSPGPVFFRQARTGLDGKDFYLYKFRSMHVNKDADTAQATEDDPRKFPFGNFMRKANIDELPQFFNVLKGDMSIVGPRPHMLHHTEMYGKLIDNYMVRLFCKPGITGWAQVTGFRGETKELWQMEERVKRDIWYVENWTFGLDIRIIFKTVKSIFVHDKNAF